MDPKENKRPNFKKKGQPKPKEEKVSKDKTSSICRHKGHFANDPVWYTRNPTLTRNAANISFGNPAGNIIRFGRQYQDTVSTLTRCLTPNQAVAGILCLRMMPAVPNKLTGCNAIDVAAKNIYSWVRHANSGHANYDSPDLMMYLLAMREAYAFAGFLIRSYALINLFKADNRYVPTGLGTALGADINDLRSHLADFKFYVNSYLTRLNALNVPNQLPMFEKAFKMYSSVFKEGKSNKDQLYGYVPATFLKFSGTTFSTGSGLIPVDVYRGVWTFADFCTYGEAILNALLNDEDVGIMSGDIRKAFGESAIYRIGTIDENLILEPIVDDFSVETIHNTTIVSGSITNKDLDYCAILQDGNGNILQNLSAVYNSSDSRETSRRIGEDVNAIIADIDRADPTVEEVTELCLYKTTINKFVSGDPEVTYYNIWAPIINEISGNAAKLSVSDQVMISGGDYVCYEATVWYVDASNTVVGNSFNSLMISSTSTNGTIAKLSQFEWAPLLTLTNSGETSFYGILGNLHNYTIMAVSTLYNMQMANLLSLLAVPASEHIR